MRVHRLVIDLIRRKNISGVLGNFPEHLLTEAAFVGMSGTTWFGDRSYITTCRWRFAVHEVDVSEPRGRFGEPMARMGAGQRKAANSANRQSATLCPAQELVTPSAMRAMCRQRLTTDFPRQGYQAMDRRTVSKHPSVDVQIASTGDSATDAAGLVRQATWLSRTWRIMVSLRGNMRPAVLHDVA